MGDERNHCVSQYCFTASMSLTTPFRTINAVNGFRILAIVLYGFASMTRVSSVAPSTVILTVNMESHIVPLSSDTSRIRSFSEYSVTSSTVDASLPIIMRVSRNLAPMPVLFSERNSTFTMCGMAFEKFSISATV